MSANEMNEYLLKLNLPHQPDPSEITVCEDKQVELRQQYHQDAMDNSLSMLSMTTSWMIDNKLTDAFQSVSVAEMHAPNKSWLVIECTEEFTDKLQTAFPNKIKDKVCLGPASKKGI